MPKFETKLPKIVEKNEICEKVPNFVKKTPRLLNKVEAEVCENMLAFARHVAADSMLVGGTQVFKEHLGRTICRTRSPLLPARIASTNFRKCDKKCRNL